jgi:uncharacterized protein (TIGR04255 family)
MLYFWNAPLIEERVNIPKKKPISNRQRQPSNDPLKRKYKNNYLTNVIAQIQFVSPLVTALNEPDPKFAALIQKTFPVASDRKMPSPSIEIMPEGQTKITPQYTRILKYSAPKQKKLVQFTDDSLTLEYNLYHSMNSLKRDVFPILDALFDCYKDVQVNRLGLRYIDKIEFKHKENSIEWEKYLKPELLASLKLVDKSTSLVRDFHILETVKDNIRLRFQYGIHNPDHPAPVRRQVFILDNDVYITG